MINSEAINIFILVPLDQGGHNTLVIGRRSAIKIVSRSIIDICERVWEDTYGSHRLALFTPRQASILCNEVRLILIISYIESINH